MSEEREALITGDGTYEAVDLEDAEGIKYKLLTTVHTEIWSDGGQDAYLQQVLSCGETLLLVDIRCNAYKNQSHARISVYNRETLTWNLVYEMLPHSMKTACTYKSGVSLGDFVADRELLVQVAAKIIHF